MRSESKTGIPRVGLIGAGWVGEKRARVASENPHSELAVVYGASRLILQKRNPRGGTPTETVWEYDDGDPSWAMEWAELLAALREGRQPLGNGQEGLRAMEIVDALYRSARAGAIVSVER